MPSYALAELSAQIERQLTDSFGKFYLYASLLRTVTVRKESFLDAIPKYRDHTAVGLVKTGMVTLSHAVGLTEKENNDKPLHTGPLDNFLADKLNAYTELFNFEGPNFFRSIKNICLTFVRKGQISDLLYILKQMNNHLHTFPMALDQYNQSIYRGVDFENRKKGVAALLQSANQVAMNAQNAVDNGVYGMASLIAALLAIKLTMLLGGVILTLLMLSAGVFSAFYFLHNAYTCFERIESAAKACYDQTENMIQEQQQSLYTPNYLNFVIKGVLAPLSYTGLTIWEQTAQTKQDARAAKQERIKLDTLYATVEENSKLSSKL